MLSGEGVVQGQVLIPASDTFTMTGTVTDICIAIGLIKNTTQHKD